HWCTAHGIVYQSFWSLTANPHILTSKLMQKLTAQYHKTAAQIFFRYLHQLGIVPLTGTRSPQHMKDDLGIFDFELAMEDVEKISGVL
ncbi:MAG TPA: aldo/keto reductase, partial [Gammaproteobacteria bacterium]|nr:aldo/keto reductase [Gammaproteobacteria bacterium]